MQYDVLLPDGKPLANLIPWTAQYNHGGGSTTDFVRQTIGSKNRRRCSERGAAFVFATLGETHRLAGVPIGRKLLLKRRESIECIQGSHGEEIHLADLLKHRMWCG